ncbi:MAG: hypothetical protein H6822_32105 [Planctomycetaceae bacterium]|nr:hypothetical protein [Planctomycetales bacterium]MCB9926828.1 hypothetical protein [Planctomycetaceae bacterium]
MSLRNTVAILLLNVLLSNTMALADKNAKLQPNLTQPGSEVLDESFSGDRLGKAWIVNKGEWSIKDGVVVGREKKEDMHAAVLTLQHPHRNSIIRFSFQLDGATGFNLSFNHAKGHLFRIGINDAGLTFTKDKDKKDPNSNAKVLAKASGEFDSGEWHTLLVELQGDKVSIQSDNGAKVSVQEPTFDVEKTGYRFVMRGESLLLDDITVWNVEQ